MWATAFYVVSVADLVVIVIVIIVIYFAIAMAVFVFVSMSNAAITQTAIYFDNFT